VQAVFLRKSDVTHVFDPAVVLGAVPPAGTVEKLPIVVPVIKFSPTNWPVESIDTYTPTNTFVDVVLGICVSNVAWLPIFPINVVVDDVAPDALIPRASRVLFEWYTILSLMPLGTLMVFMDGSSCGDWGAMPYSCETPPPEQ